MLCVSATKWIALPAFQGHLAICCRPFSLHNKKSFQLLHSLFRHKFTLDIAIFLLYSILPVVGPNPVRAQSLGSFRAFTPLSIERTKEGRKAVVRVRVMAPLATTVVGRHCCNTIIIIIAMAAMACFEGGSEHVKAFII